ncbi:carboxylesterase family protein [Anatilimnocola floriformis]|uniref:carboxylesterase family protein n=1 Tax=Anatilimnocola floriformis TaxID=2948575 RepID=UPI0020C49A4F|nr:alpha/beta fold hydrolase [Anatilimnocola floriformis]
MKMPLVLLLALATALSAADKPQPDQKGLNFERLKAADANKDGLLTAEELGETLWKRISPYDADANGKLDAAELAALAAPKGNDKKNERPGGANSSFTVDEQRANNGQTLRYSLFVPPNATEPLPLVLCLHGAGGNTAAANLLASPASQKKYPCVVLAPACDGRSTRWVESSFRGKEKQRSVTPELMEILDKVVQETKADPKRVYVTGQSMGGVGTWGLIASYPDRFAAAVPICGIWEPADAPKMAKVPIWAFHGAKDPTVPVEGSRRMIAAVMAAGGEPKYTEFPDVGHGSWDSAYSTDGLWEWVFKQHR